MKRIAIGTGIAGILTAGSLALAGTATAAALGGSSAENAVDQLRAEGYNVQLNLNGTRDVPLSECTVTGVHGLPNSAGVDGSAGAAQFTTVYVDVDCPSDN
ncbi:MAG: hypothetical protein JO044_03110 [Mycobacteriaceae bacterium]|nr:hypothetical protein [Mycobacteriaceae bacterium]MBV9641551.1 hypothetical protein [Mycobacteriaceae bacterium]